MSLWASADVKQQLSLSGLAAQFTAGQRTRCRDLLLQAAADLQSQLK